MGQVHDGLWQGLHQTNPFSRKQSMYDTLVSQLRGAQQQGKDLYLAGHSLGGSLMTILAALLLQRSGSDGSLSAAAHSDANRHCAHAQKRYRNIELSITMKFHVPNYLHRHLLGS